jgi:hypothetical protein
MCRNRVYNGRTWNYYMNKRNLVITAFFIIVVTITYVLITTKIPIQTLKNKDTLIPNVIISNEQILLAKSEYSINTNIYIVKGTLENIGNNTAYTVHLNITSYFPNGDVAFTSALPVGFDFPSHTKTQFLNLKPNQTFSGTLAISYLPTELYNNKSCISSYNIETFYSDTET